MFLFKTISSALSLTVLLFLSHSLQHEYTNTALIMLAIMLPFHLISNFILSRSFAESQRNILRWILAIGLFYGAAVVLGAPLGIFAEDRTVGIQNLLWSTMMSSFMFLFLSHELDSSFPPSTMVIMATTWMSAFVIPLDWDRPYQPFPVCTTFGLLAGDVVSTLLCLMDSSRRSVLVKPQAPSKSQ